MLATWHAGYAGVEVQRGGFPRPDRIFLKAPKAPGAKISAPRPRIAQFAIRPSLQRSTADLPEGGGIDLAINIIRMASEVPGRLAPTETKNKERRALEYGIPAAVDSAVSSEIDGRPD